MSKLYSVELIMDDNPNELTMLLDELKKLSTCDNMYLAEQIKENKEALIKIKTTISRVFIDFSSKDLDEVIDLVCDISYSYPNSVLNIRIESNDFFIETTYKGGELICKEEFKTLVEWRLYTHSMKLCSQDVRRYIEKELEYLIEQIYTFDEFKSFILDEFKNIKFNKLYTKENLLNDIEKCFIIMMY